MPLRLHRCRWVCRPLIAGHTTSGPGCRRDRRAAQFNASRRAGSVVDAIKLSSRWMYFGPPTRINSSSSVCRPRSGLLSFAQQRPRSHLVQVFAHVIDIHTPAGPRTQTLMCLFPDPSRTIGDHAQFRRVLQPHPLAPAFPHRAHQSAVHNRATRQSARSLQAARGLSISRGPPDQPAPVFAADSAAFHAIPRLCSPSGHRCRSPGCPTPSRMRQPSVRSPAATGDTASPSC